MKAWISQGGYRALAILTVTLLTACQGAAPPQAERDGYFTWVDEQGRVRSSPIPAATPAPDTEAPAGTPVPGNRPEPPLAAEPVDDYTLENYPDGDELAAHGFVRPGQPKPYFTWRDADGNIRVSYYTRDLRSDPDRPEHRGPVDITEATVYQGPVPASPERPVAGYDPDALTILGVEPDDFFSRFTRDCCTSLNPADHTRWVTGREFEVDLTPETPTHRFSTGDSPFALVALPLPREYPDFLMQLRSYADDGLFVPSLAFLDRNLKPVRVITDLATTFTPESWHTRAYLEARVPVFPARGERWLLLFTRDRDLDGQTVHEGPGGVRAIPHGRTGELGLRLITED
ncbi:MalM family protein [uncultured Marinobacter sp.]|jgi:hypothetical protein|uniref:MalM family protein n=1 Tax=uncultured Marinobacter sp. TaxID=187379 RepID=UPI000C0A9776|nr:hypothetical protein [Marinobacter sp.]MBI42633.1 hypothetical protein [Oceanospirillales bacterium]|tara:strand:- start:1230 stop:2264 length:1035 start_codon:yes stop_codon:yes gene_type:complete